MLLLPLLRIACMIGVAGISPEDSLPEVRPLLCSLQEVYLILEIVVPDNLRG